MADAEFSVIIPARFGSTRFPGKVLALIRNKPMIQHVVERALESGAKRIIVATDNQKVADAITGCCEVKLTSDKHESGTERLAEVVTSLSMDSEDIVVNVQGDEPFVPAQNIQQVANLLAASKTHMATLCTPIKSKEDIVNPNVVKVVRNVKGHALYFSRATIPFERGALLNDITDPSQADMGVLRRHIGIYAYTVSYIKQYVNYSPSTLEKIESLEQLRALWYGDSIAIADALAEPPIGIDTPSDLDKLLKTLLR